jgi:flavin-dependent dehydrogenase
MSTKKRTFVIVGAGLAGAKAAGTLRDEGYDEIGMECLGYAPEWDEVVVRASSATREFVAFWLRDERVVAGMNVNVWDVSMEALIRSRQRVDAAQLADPGAPLDTLVEKGRSAHVR